MIFSGAIILEAKLFGHTKGGQTQKRGCFQHTRLYFSIPKRIILNFM